MNPSTTVSGRPRWRYISTVHSQPTKSLALLFFVSYSFSLNCLLQSFLSFKSQKALSSPRSFPTLCFSPSLIQVTVPFLQSSPSRVTAYFKIFNWNRCTQVADTSRTGSQGPGAGAQHTQNLVLPARVAKSRRDGGRRCILKPKFREQSRRHSPNTGTD